MIRLASVIHTFESAFLAQYRERLRPEHTRALAAMKQCRTQASPKLQLPVHRNASTTRWCRIPAAIATARTASTTRASNGSNASSPSRCRPSTSCSPSRLPAQLRALAWAHQGVLYDLLLRCAWETVRSFSRNDRQLRGVPGAIAVLHTNTRALDYHPHVHLVMPAAAIDAERKQWRTKRRGKGKGGYLFNHKALAKVFRAKMLAGIEAAGLTLPERYPGKWVVDCKSVGSGKPALDLSGPLSLPRCDPRERHPRLRPRPSALPLPQRQDRQVRTAAPCPARTSSG